MLTIKELPNGWTVESDPDNPNGWARTGVPGGIRIVDTGPYDASTGTTPYIAGEIQPDGSIVVRDEGTIEGPAYHESVRKVHFNTFNK